MQTVCCDAVSYDYQSAAIQYFIQHNDGKIHVEHSLTECSFFRTHNFLRNERGL